MNPSAGVIVLMYHRVRSARNAWEAAYAITPQTFEAHLLGLAAPGIHAGSVRSLADWLGNGASLAAGACARTSGPCWRPPRRAGTRCW